MNKKYIFFYIPTMQISVSYLFYKISKIIRSVIETEIIEKMQNCLKLN